MVDMEALIEVMDDAGFPAEPFIPNYLAFCYHNVRTFMPKPIALYALAYPDTMPQELKDAIAEKNAVAPVITSTSPLPAATQNVAYSVQLQATGTLPILWSLDPMVPLPTGLELDEETGIISGTPTQTGQFNLIVIATNAAGLNDKSLTLFVS